MARLTASFGSVFLDRTRAIPSLRVMAEPIQATLNQTKAKREIRHEFESPLKSWF